MGQEQKSGGDGGTMLVYSLLWTVAVVVGAPWWGFRLLTRERYREGLGERLGRVPEALLRFVTGKRVVWVHAVSVGEVLAATRLVEELEAALGEAWVVVVSTTTRTGQALARERFGAERGVLLSAGLGVGGAAVSEGGAAGGGGVDGERGVAADAVGVRAGGGAGGGGECAGER